MNIFWTKEFEKHYKKRVLPYKSIDLRFKNRIMLFAKDSKNPVLKDHQLTGKFKKYRAFWIKGDLRVVYKLQGKSCFFYDIGTHNQVY